MFEFPRIACHFITGLVSLEAILVVHNTGEFRSSGVHGSGGWVDVSVANAQHTIGTGTWGARACEWRVS